MSKKGSSKNVSKKATKVEKKTVLSVRVSAKNASKAEKILKAYGFKMSTPNYGWVHASAIRSPKTDRLAAAMVRLNRAGFSASVKEVR